MWNHRRHLNPSSPFYLSVALNTTLQKLSVLYGAFPIYRGCRRRRYVRPHTTSISLSLKDLVTLLHIRAFLTSLWRLLLRWDNTIPTSHTLSPRHSQPWRRLR